MIRRSTLPGLSEALSELRLDHPGEARRILQSLLNDDAVIALDHEAFAIEVEALLRAGQNDEAIRRLDLFLNPKFKAPGLCGDAYRTAMESAT